MEQIEELDGSFLSVIESLSEQKLSNCYQCLKCSVGCPVAYIADYKVNQIVRLIQMNQSARVLQSSMIWLCTACETCGTRCPNNINMAPVMDTLKQLALRKEEEQIAKEEQISVFHSLFLKSIKSNGRIHELSMIGQLRLKTGGIFADMGIALEMIKKGKLKILPDRIKGLKDLRKAFDEEQVG